MQDALSSQPATWGKGKQLYLAQEDKVPHEQAR